MARSCVGLDIGTSAIKVVELTRKGDKCLLTRVGVTSLPMGAIEGGMVRDIATVAQILARLLKETRIKTKRVMAAVAGQAVIVRSLKFPSMPRHELAQAVRFEAERYIPFPAEEAAMDFDVTGENPETNEIEVMLVAAQRGVVESHVQTLRAVGLQPIIVDVQPFALVRSLHMYLMDSLAMGSPMNVAFLDIGAGTTDLVIFRDEVLRFTRIIPIGGNYFTRAIAGRLGVSEEEAEAMKIAHGQVILEPEAGLDNSQDAQLSSVITAVAGELVTEIRRSFDYFRLQSREDISRVVATGGGIMLRNLVGYLEHELGLRIEIGDPLERLHPNSRNCAPHLLPGAGPIFSVAIGLALRGVEEE
ncbi:MAG: type IV pilus assembly protein PilM [Bacillota bacterium]